MKTNQDFVDRKSNFTPVQGKFKNQKKHPLSAIITKKEINRLKKRASREKINLLQSHGLRPWACKQAQ